MLYWFDCLHLEEGLTLNHFNMLQNSDFTRANGSVPTEWVNGYNSQFAFTSIEPIQSPANTLLTGNSLRVQGLYYLPIQKRKSICC